MILYTDNDSYVCEWTRNLIEAGLLLPGDVVEADITNWNLKLSNYEQCHFFNGIGGWPFALKLAGWPESEPVWTGSCPCQPISCAGKRKGHADKRHLWPAFYSLIAQCKPSTIVGEQVDGVDGREWLAGIRADLEGIGYAVGCAGLCAASVGSPHIRQRLYWVAHSNRNGWTTGHRQIPSYKIASQSGLSSKTTGWLGNSDSTGSQGWSKRLVECAHQWPPGTPNLAMLCADGRARRIKSGLQPLAHGVSARVAKLRSIGNAIVPQVAAKFIRAFIATQKSIDNLVQVP